MFQRSPPFPPFAISSNNESLQLILTKFGHSWMCYEGLYFPSLLFLVLEYFQVSIFQAQGATILPKGVNVMGAGHSCPDACVAGETAPQIIVAEKVIHEQPQGEDEQAQEQVTYKISTRSKIRRSFLLERKLHTDTEIMRGLLAAEPFPFCCSLKWNLKLCTVF